MIYFFFFQLLTIKIGILMNNAITLKVLHIVKPNCFWKDSFGIVSCVAYPQSRQTRYFEPSLKKDAFCIIVESYLWALGSV